MNKRTLRILEYNKILEMLSEYAASPMAKKRCQKMKPQKELCNIEKFQEQTRDALLRINRYGSVSFSGLREISASLRLLEIHSALSANELLLLADLLETADSVKKYGENGGGSKKDVDETEVSNDSLTNMFSELMPLSFLSTEIRRCILSAEEICDDASSNLKRIRKEILFTNERLHGELSKLIKNDSSRSYLQDSLITMRNGRYCIPVKQEYRGHFPGMIHDQSSTGSTLFIEPMAVVNLNNQIKELQSEEHIEIEKILSGLSEQASGYIEDIMIDTNVLTELDFIFARAKFAISYNGSEPVFNTEGIIDIKKGRHPLLEKHKCVPVDIKLGENYTLLIVTGPNTGGKTVSLKTLGLFTLMGQAGLHIPALDGSRLAVFEDVFADIGDEQSIEQNLSTFSSHMSNIVYIVNHASPNTLCLFDEPGGGTDPIEGAALAISILSHLKGMGARCMATTHYSELKTFALTEPGVENASCEFDVATLQPTYKLMIGIPGKSNAFAISHKLGLPDYIIDYAKNNIEQSAIDIEGLIADLENSRKKIEEDRAIIERERNEAEALRKRLSEKEKTLDDKKQDILAKAREEARTIVEEAKDVADTTIRDYNKWRTNPNKADLKKMEEKRAGLRKKLDTYEKNKPKKVETSGHNAKDFKIGDSVHVISMNCDGHIIELPDKNGNLLVQMGILSSRLPASDLVIFDEEKRANDNGLKRKPAMGNKKTGAMTGLSKAYTFSPEINLLGKTVDEAISELEKFLDDAMLTHSSPVRVIHGKGTGALRKGVHDYLRRNRQIKGYHLAEYGEGDAGVTIVEL